MNQPIHNILQTQGWYEIEKMFKVKINECVQMNIPKDKSDQIVAREARVKGEVSAALTSLLKKIKLAGKVEEVKKSKVLR